MCVVVAAQEASTVIHSICCSLHVPEVWSQDVDVTVAMEVAQRGSTIDFQLECLAKQS